MLLQGELLEDRFSGTPDYASNNSLRGGRCAAKDDCESLAYSLLEMWNGNNLPRFIPMTPQKSPESDGCFNPHIPAPP